MPPPSNARILAPIALAAFVVAVIAVAAGTLGSDDPRSAPPTAEQPSTATSTTPASTGESDPAGTTGEEGGTAIVQAGDTPSAIAEREGIALERLLELNPDIDPTALRAGQELKLEP